jgi:hypothetical protein
LSASITATTVLKAAWSAITSTQKAISTRRR